LNLLAAPAETCGPHHGRGVRERGAARHRPRQGRQVRSSPPQDRHPSDRRLQPQAELWPSFPHQHLAPMITMHTRMRPSVPLFSTSRTFIRAQESTVTRDRWLSLPHSTEETHTCTCYGGTATFPISGGLICMPRASGTLVRFRLW